MKTKLLLPHKLKKIGWIMLLPFLLLGILTLHFEFYWEFLNINLRDNPSGWKLETENLTNELAGVGLLISLFLIGFSKLKVEDEYTFQLRLDSLLWSLYIYCGLMLLSLIFIYSTDFVVALVYNAFALLLIYNVRFHYYINKNEKSD